VLYAPQPGPHCGSVGDRAGRRAKTAAGVPRDAAKDAVLCEMPAITASSQRSARLAPAGSNYKATRTSDTLGSELVGRINPRPRPQPTQSDHPAIPEPAAHRGGAAGAHAPRSARTMRAPPSRGQASPLRQPRAAQPVGRCGARCATPDRSRPVQIAQDHSELSTAQHFCVLRKYGMPSCRA
jgi:hypothetical protein